MRPEKLAVSALEKRHTCQSNSPPTTVFLERQEISLAASMFLAHFYALVPSQRSLITRRCCRVGVIPATKGRHLFLAPEAGLPRRTTKLSQASTDTTPVRMISNVVRWARSQLSMTGLMERRAKPAPFDRASSRLWARSLTHLYM